MFRFRLEPVLRVKRIKEDQRKKEFGEALSRFWEESKRLEELKRKRMEYLGALGKITDPFRLKLSIEYARYLEGEIRRSERRLEELRREVETKRSALIEAMKERKILERLKEKRLEEYRREELLKEIKSLDEIASLRFAR